MRPRRFFVLSILFLLLQIGVCSGMEIDKVILYNDSALITFHRTIAERLSLDVPSEFIPESLVLTPMNGALIRSVSIEPSRGISGRAGELESLLQKKQTTLAVLKKDQSMLEKQIDIIYDAAGSKGKASAFEKIRLTEALGFIETKVSGLNARIVELNRKAQKMEVEIKDLQEQLGRIGQHPGFRIEIAGSGTVEISYVVRGASWTPEYKVNAMPQSSQISIESCVSARQSTGADWEVKELLVSTGRPGFGIEAPVLSGWYLSKAPRRTGRFKTEDLDTAPMMAAAPAEEYEGVVEATSASYLLGAARNIVLQGDGKPVSVKVAKLSSKAEFSMISIPKFSQAAYLRSVFTLAGNAPLVPGTYSSYVDGVFSGRGTMKRSEPGQEMTLDLGVDEGIRVERKETRVFRDKTLTGKDRVTYSYEITIENTRKQKASITVKDQIPVSRDKSIEVELTGSSPEVKSDQDGILTWTMSLGPNEKKSASFTFYVVGDVFIPR